MQAFEDLRFSYRKLMYNIELMSANVEVYANVQKYMHSICVLFMNTDFNNGLHAFFFTVLFVCFFKKSTCLHMFYQPW